MQDTVSEYAILQKLGAGGMSQVYLARRLSDEALVVLKSLHPQQAQRAAVAQRFYQEAVLLSRLSHPAIVQLYDFFVQEGVPYLVMEYVPGQSLQSILNLTRAPISWTWTYETLKPILEALGYLHTLGIIHRDLKPSNIMVLPDGGAKLLDFGIAKMLNSDLSLTQTGAQVGTVLYMAPEQIRGQAVSPQTDLYAMGLILYECLCGTYPWPCAGKPLYELYKLILEAPLTMPSWAPAAWREFFKRALAKKTKDRFPSAESMLAAFAALGEATPSTPQTTMPSSLTSKPSQSPEPVETQTTPPVLRRKPSKLPRTAPLAGITLLLLVGLGLLLWGLLRGWATSSATEKSPPPSETTQAAAQENSPPPSTSPSPSPASAAPSATQEADTLSSSPTSRAFAKLSSPALSPSSPSQPQAPPAPASSLEAAIQREMEAFAHRRKATLNRDLQWAPLPVLPSANQGEIEVPFQEKYAKKELTSEDTFEDCPGGGIRRVTTHYEQTLNCTRRAKARIHYAGDPHTGQPQIQIFESFSSDTEECTPTYRRPKDRKIGECQ